MKTKVNILIVDDQPGKRLGYEAILGELGENLIQATSGGEALHLLLKNDIAVVLMDVNMPELDGFQLADMMRQHPRFEETAIVFVSAVHMTDLDRLKGYERGGVDYVSVPIIPELLRAKVRVFADLHRKSRQLDDLNGMLRLLSSRLIVAQDVSDDGLRGSCTTVYSRSLLRQRWYCKPASLKSPSRRQLRLLIVRLRKFVLCLTCCILPCWMKLDWLQQLRLSPTRC
jgi:CheY-like chemotaxis protein